MRSALLALASAAALCAYCRARRQAAAARLRARQLRAVLRRCGGRPGRHWRVGDCPPCAGPVTVLDVPSGEVVGRLGGSKFDNIEPSISPDGSQGCVRARLCRRLRAHSRPLDSRCRQQPPAAASWTNDGGTEPLWAPAGDQIAYLKATANSSALLLIPAHGGRSRTRPARSRSRVRLVPERAEHRFRGTRTTRGRERCKRQGALAAQAPLRAERRLVAGFGPFAREHLTRSTVQPTANRQSVVSRARK